MRVVCSRSQARWRSWIELGTQSAAFQRRHNDDPYPSTCYCVSLVIHMCGNLRLTAALPLRPVMSGAPALVQV
jgi:hypothetical protein